MSESCPVSVSVLVAVYNVEAYLAACLDSLLSQTLRDIQVICVDDGSTDGSWALLRQYAGRDARIEAYRLDANSGQARARNEALRHARGRYVAFLDSDDWFDADSLQQAVAVFERHPLTDCVIMRVIQCFDDGRRLDYEKPVPMVMSGADAFERSLDWSVHGWYVARRELYEQWPYDETCKSYSDDNTTRQHYFHSRQVRYAPESRYYYRCYAQSVTRRPSARRFDYLRANESMRRQLLELGVGRELVDRYERHRWLNLVGVYMFYHVHGRQLPEADARWGLHELHRAWTTIDRGALDRKTAAKFGYRPCRRWWLFRVQEWCYFTLRGLLGRNC